MRLVLMAVLCFGDVGWIPPVVAPPLQFVVVGFDGAGDAADVTHWIDVGTPTLSAGTLGTLQAPLAITNVRQRQAP